MDLGSATSNQQPATTNSNENPSVVREGNHQLRTINKEAEDKAA
jgi:hypothetical protein